MIDTIVLTLENKEYKIVEPDKFSPSFNALNQPGRSGGRAFMTCKQNPTASELRQGNYKPRLTVTRRWNGKEVIYPLKIEFSAPKMLYGNNFDELSDKDREPLIQKLVKVLKSMGVEIYPFYLRKARVASIHYSKNFQLTNFTTCSMIISELAKIDLSKRLDLSQRDYRNEGHILHYHANSYEIVFYDKIKDLQQAKTSEKRSIEKDNVVQLSLFNQYPKNKSLEVLRMEIRLGTAIKIKQMLKKIGKEEANSFEYLFSRSISRSIIEFYWQEIKESAELLMIDTRDIENLFQRICESNKGIKTQKALAICTALLLIDKNGVRRFRQLLSLTSSGGYWYDFNKSLSQSIKPLKGKKFMALEELDNKIKVFEPITVIKEQAI